MADNSTSSGDDSLSVNVLGSSRSEGNSGYGKRKAPARKRPSPTTRSFGLYYESLGNVMAVVHQTIGKITLDPNDRLVETDLNHLKRAIETNVLGFEDLIKKLEVAIENQQRMRSDAASASIPLSTQHSFATIDSPTKKKLLEIKAVILDLVGALGLYVGFVEYIINQTYGLMSYSPVVENQLQKLKFRCDNKIFLLKKIRQEIDDGNAQIANIGNAAAAKSLQTFANNTRKSQLLLESNLKTNLSEE